jgi:hypothetical protein
MARKKGPVFRHQRADRRVDGRGSLYPVVQVRSRSGQLVDAVTPYALTNPVFVDVDGNGRFDPPLPGVIRPLPADGG